MIKKWVASLSPAWLTVYSMIAAFGVYFCMYAFRKPYTAATFDNKEILVLAQLIGYLLSKFYGIKFISELSGNKRAYLILILITFSQIMLVGFAYLPGALRQYDFIFMFLNGFPLGLIWGIVFSYLEGRKFTEILAAGLTVSFIISSGAVKSIGKFLIIDLGASDYTMPLLVGLLFVPPIIFFTFMLAQIPVPNKEDISVRTERKPMTSKERRLFLQGYSIGIIVLTLSYMMFTALRDIRETFANEIWNDLGINKPAIFSVTELPIGLIIGVILALCFRIKDNVRAFRFYHTLILIGLVLISSSTILFSFGGLHPIAWMIILGIGSYMAYVTFACVLFDRLIGALKFSGNAGFIIYIMDSMGYVGSAIILIYKTFAQPEMNWLQFFTSTAMVVSVLGSLLIITSIGYFNTKIKKYKKLQYAPGS